MEINGLPLHPLVIHAAVIFGPLAALPRSCTPWSRRGVTAAAPDGRARRSSPARAVVAAYLTGNNFLDSKPELRQLDRSQTHEDRPGSLLWVTLAFAVVALIAAGCSCTARAAVRGRASQSGSLLDRAAGAASCSAVDPGVAWS